MEDDPEEGIVKSAVVPSLSGQPAEFRGKSHSAKLSQRSALKGKK
jgi:hypothetical protein